MIPFAEPRSCQHTPQVAIIGGGPAGLMAAETLAHYGFQVAVYEALPSVGRKFLLAGRGGLNLTHSEPLSQFALRYGARQAEIAPLLHQFSPEDLRHWADALGANTFIGSSGRIFPAAMKAAPLLRAWLNRLRHQGIHFFVRHRWLGWAENGALRFQTPSGEQHCLPQAVILALGGGSRAKFGGNQDWIPLLRNQGVTVADLVPANCGFDLEHGWSEHFRTRFSGHPVKTITASSINLKGETLTRAGELLITKTGIEGGLIYALAASLRDTIDTRHIATLTLDLAPGRTLSRLITELSRPRGRRSFSTHLQTQTGLKGVKASLLHEYLSDNDLADPTRLATMIKSLPLRLNAPRPIDEAISTAGGVTFDSLDKNLMLHTLPGVFCAGEMLDWEAPTGGYLLTACFASGHTAGKAAAAWLST